MTSTLLQFSKLLKRAVTEGGAKGSKKSPRHRWMVTARQGLLEKHINKLEEMEASEPTRP